MAFLVGLALGTAICGIPYVAYGAEFPPWQITMLALGLAAAGLAVVWPRNRWWSATGVATGILVPIVATIVIDSLRDPTSHNLAPFELVIGLSVSVPPALAGALLGGFASRLASPRLLVGAALAALGLAAAIANSGVMLGQTVASESAGKAKMRSLLAAQARFRVANPAIGFACDLNQLGERFDTPARRYSPSRPATGIYVAGTQAVAADYAYTLVCSNDPGPRTGFALWATPSQVTLGRQVYCAEADGRLRAAGRHRFNFCLSEGVAVAD
jgi:hypothetical protein